MDKDVGMETGDTGTSVIIITITIVVMIIIFYIVENTVRNDNTTVQQSQSADHLRTDDASKKKEPQKTSENILTKDGHTGTSETPGTQTFQQTQEFPRQSQSFHSKVQHSSSSSIEADVVPLSPRSVSGSDKSQDIEKVKEMDDVFYEQEFSSIGNITVKEFVCSESENVTELEQEQHMEELKEKKASYDDPSSQDNYDKPSQPAGHHKELHIPKPHHLFAKQSHSTEVEEYLPNKEQMLEQSQGHRHEVRDLNLPRTEAWTPALQHSSKASEWQDRHIHLPSPHPAWRFDKLLVDLNKEITSEKELATLKYRFESDFRKGAIEGIKEPMALFRKMKERDLLNPNNIIYLQAILWELGSPELVEKTIEYCENIGNTLFFKPATNTPVNGYKYVKFHVYTKEKSRDMLLDLQLKVATILCVPPEFIFIAAVEPSSSLTVTLMIPDIAANILVKSLAQRRHQLRLAHMSIDQVTIEGKTYTIEATEERGPSQSEVQIVSLYQQLTNKTKQLDRMEEKCERLEAIIKDLEKERTNDNIPEVHQKGKHLEEEQPVPFQNQQLMKNIQQRRKRERTESLRDNIVMQYREIKQKKEQLVLMKESYKDSLKKKIAEIKPTVIIITILIIVTLLIIHILRKRIGHYF